MNLIELNKLIEQRYIDVNTHNNCELFIYNYSRSAQYESLWNDITLSCRGLIMDANNNIVARPFKKFFNYEELVNKDVIPTNLPYEVYSKMDGSLLIVFNWNHKWLTATRGSFHSNQAVKGEEILYSKYSDLFDKMNLEWTYLFEVIYPENRIVLDYNGLTDIILLAIIDKNTGNEIDINENSLGFKTVKRFKEFENKSFKDLQDMNISGEEGYVLKYSNGFRVKVKFSEYVRLHKILSTISEHSIWELLYNEGNVNSILEQLPDEQDKWLREMNNTFLTKYSEIENEVVSLYEEVKYLKDDKKEYALKVLNDSKYKKYSSILFNIKDGKNYSKMIWKFLEP